MILTDFAIFWYCGNHIHVIVMCFTCALWLNDIFNSHVQYHIVVIVVRIIAVSAFNNDLL